MQVGDVVRLNSGGVNMTVTIVHPDGTVAVAYTQEGRMVRDVYHQSCLTIVGLAGHGEVAEAAKRGFGTIHTDKDKPERSGT